MRIIALFSFVILLSSCWLYTPREPMPPQRQWGNKAIFAARDIAAEVKYLAQKQPVKRAGNIYAYGPYIFQMDNGSGIHVIDNHNPAQADRIGFITVNGCDQISIKGNFLYTNSYNDLVTIDISDANNIRLINRVQNAFPSFQYNYPMATPDERGYYDCRQYTDSVVVGWVKDSLSYPCFKN